MIDALRSTPAPADEPAEPATRFQIDPTWFADKGLSFEHVVRARICEIDLKELGREREERVPIFDQESGRPRFEVRKALYGSDPVKVIRDHCGRAKNYITRDMPTLEAVFRVLLANGNAPMSLEQVREALAEWCPGGGCQWLLLPVESLDRLLRHDHNYGLREATEPRS
ncbi:MAG: hypothetical protein HYX52_07690 [Chloroflexi bacterium]|nr:hypothetical protein [Chloroflexota bacterium]